MFSVVEWETRRVGLLELGRGHALQIQDWMAVNEGLRGLSFELVRSSHSKQSRVDMRLVTDSTPLFFRHLEGPDVVRAVESTWQRAASQSLNECLPGESSQRGESPEARPAKARSA